MIRKANAKNRKLTSNKKESNLLLLENENLKLQIELEKLKQGKLVMEDNETTLENFKTELKELLSKYNADIGFNASGEFTDIYDYGMYIDVGKDTIDFPYEWEISSSDIK